MKVFLHHLYEYRKGLRNLVLHTTSREHLPDVESKLEKEGVSYIVYPVGVSRINVIFGDETCIKVIEDIGKSDLHRYTAEEDFILGIMLGYDRHRQCQRYLYMKAKKHRARADLAVLNQ